MPVRTTLVPRQQARNDVIMISEEAQERLRGWFTGRLPEEWRTTTPQITADREEMTVILGLPDVDVAERRLAGPEKSRASASSAAQIAEARAGRAKAFRESTRERRMEIASEAEHRYGRKVSWGVAIGEGEDAHRELFTARRGPGHDAGSASPSVGSSTRSSTPESRGPGPDALGWCVRLVGQHEGDWLDELRQAMSAVADVRSKGPAA